VRAHNVVHLPLPPPLLLLLLLLLLVAMQVWPGATHYPDFLSTDQTWPWWQTHIQQMYNKVCGTGGAPCSLTLNPKP
jgi:hypothetical protein